MNSRRITEFSLYSAVSRNGANAYAAPHRRGARKGKAGQTGPHNGSLDSLHVRQEAGIPSLLPHAPDDRNRPPSNYALTAPLPQEAPKSRHRPHQSEKGVRSQAR